MKSLFVIFISIVHLLFHPSPKNDVKKTVAPLNAHSIILAKPPIHNIIFTDDKGQQHPLFDSTKKVNMVVFWASWCSACRLEIPYLKEVYPGIDPATFRVVSISVDKDKDAWLKAMKEEKMPWPQLLAEGDNLKGIKDNFGFNSIPQIYFIDNKGNILNTYSGYHYDDGAGLKELVKQYGSK